MKNFEMILLATIPFAVMALAAYMLVSEPQFASTCYDPPIKGVYPIWSVYACNETWNSIVTGMRPEADASARKYAFESMDTYHKYCGEHLLD